MNEVYFENIQSEIEDDYSDDSLFNIISWGADISFIEIVTMYDEDELIKPEIQRKYIWDKNTASRFIESILFGLPVPNVFFAKCENKKLIIDGYQRIIAVYDYIKGIFSGDGRPFRLSNSNKINYRWRNKLFSELNIYDQRNIKDTILHAVIFEQKHPENNDTSLYQIFERINTSGKTLTPQEIRNCVYQGTFNKLLFELNNNSAWRKLYGSDEPDNRMRDIECILRFFVMKSSLIKECTATQISLKKYLNDFMQMNQNVSVEKIEKYREEFLLTMQTIYDTIGKNAYRNYSSESYLTCFNPALFDAISIAYYNILFNKGNKILKFDHKKLFNDDKFILSCKQQTTNIKNIRYRINFVENFITGTK